MNIYGNNTVEDMNDEEKEGAINQGKNLEILCLVCALTQTCHNISANSIIYLLRLIWFHFWPNKVWLSFIWLSLFTWNLLGVQIGNSFQFLVKSDMWEIMPCYSRVVNFGSTRQKWEMTFLWLRWWCCWWCFHKGASTRRQIGDYFSNFKIPTSVYREREIILENVSRYGLKLKILLIKIGDCYSDLDRQKNNNDDEEEDVQGDRRPTKGNQIGKFPGEI